jgi:hypothetical protein
MNRALKDTWPFLGAGLAALAARVVVHFSLPELRYGAHGGVDPLWLRLCIAAVFFGVLAVLGRDLLRRIGPPQDPLARADASSFKPKSTPRETAAEMARVYSDVTDDASRVRAIGEWLSGILTSTVLVPFIFYLRFGEVGPLGWGLTVFFDVYCLLWAFGLYFLPRTEYHTQEPLAKLSWENGVIRNES